MAKTIVIPSADFSENALEQVTFTSIPCVGVTLEHNSLTFTETGETKVLKYILSPYNTTDQLSIVSSNTNIITVSNNVLTAVGIGECAVTVTCGTASAVCVISSTAEADFMAVGKLRMSHTGNYKSCLFSETQSFITLGRNDPDGYQIGLNSSGNKFVISSAINLCPIPIPKNTGTIRVTAPYQGRMYWVFFNSKECQTSFGNDPSALITKMAEYAYSVTVDAKSVDIPFNDVSTFGQAVVNVEGTDSIGVLYYNSTNYPSMTLGEEIPGFTIEFIPAADN